MTPQGQKEYPLAPDWFARIGRGFADFGVADTNSALLLLPTPPQGSDRLLMIDLGPRGVPSVLQIVE